MKVIWNKKKFYKLVVLIIPLENFLLYETDIGILNISVFIFHIAYPKSILHP